MTRCDETVKAFTSAAVETHSYLTNCHSSLPEDSQVIGLPVYTERQSGQRPCVSPPPLQRGASRALGRCTSFAQSLKRKVAVPYFLLHPQHGLGCGVDGSLPPAWVRATQVLDEKEEGSWTLPQQDLSCIVDCLSILILLREEWSGMPGQPVGSSVQRQHLKAYQKHRISGLLNYTWL